MTVGMMLLWAWDGPIAPADWTDNAIKLGERFGVAFIFAIGLAFILWKVVAKQNATLEVIVAAHAKSIEDLERACAAEREELFQRYDAHQVNYIQREAERSKEAAAREQRTAEVYHATLDKILQKVGA